MKPLTERALLVAGSVAVVLLLGEIATRLWLGLWASKRQFTLYATAEEVTESVDPRYARHHYLPFIPTPNFRDGRNRHNALGFRGEEIVVPKPEHVFRIALLGGSTTYTTAVDDYRLSYPYLLEEQLRERGWRSVQVVNAGCGRYSTWESLLNLALRVLDLDPDLLIIYHGVNDVHDRLVYPYDRYRGDNSGSRVPYTRPRTGLLEHSALLRVLLTRLGLRQSVAGLLYLRTFEYLPTNHAQTFRDQLRSRSYPAGLFRDHPVREMLARNEPSFFRRNLEGMIAMGRMHGADIILMTFASAPGRPRTHATSEAYRDAYAEQNEAMLDLCRVHGMLCYDFAREMPKDRRYWHDGRHVNVLGARTKAALVARFLSRSGLLPARGPSRAD